MRLFTKSFLVLLLVGAITVSCKKDEDSKPETQIQFEKLSKSWSLTSASLDGNSRTSDFTGVVLTISGSFQSQNPLGPYNYSFAGTFPNPSPWPQSDTWLFGENAVNSAIIRQSDDIVITYTLSNNDETLGLNFNYPEGSPGARVGEVSGDWEFVFSAN